MGLFEEQLRKRIRLDTREISDRMEDVADSLRGVERYHAKEVSNANARHEIETICQFYHMPFPGDVPENLSEINELIDYITRPSGIMRRRVLLEDKWYINGSGVLLAIKKSDGSFVALFPGKIRGYTYFDENGNVVRVTKQNCESFETEALCFYRPLPSKPMETKDFYGILIRNMISSDLYMVLFVTLLATLLGMITPYATKLLFLRIIPTKKEHMVLTVAFVMVAVAVAVYLTNVMKVGLLERIRGKMDVFMENAFMSRVMRLPANFFSGKSAGGLAESILSLRILPDVITGAVLGPGIMAVFSVIYVIEIAVIAPSMALPAFLTLALQLVIIVFSLKQKMKVIRKELEADMATQGISYALITGIQRIKLSGSENRMLSRWLDRYKGKTAAAYRMRFPASLQNELVTFAALLGTLWAYLLGAKGNIEVSEFAAFLSAFALATNSLTALSQAGQMIAYIKPISDMIEPILKATPESGEEKKNAGRLSGSIEMSHVSFRYEEDGPLIVNDMSLKIRPGEYVALVGKSGCGKSTILRLLMGFETPQNGTVMYDGRNLNELDLASVRRNIGIVLQNGKLFAGDVFSNITISAPWLTMKDAWEAAEMAGVADHIREMPMGMNTLISEGSGGISGGQKQRLIIARAIAPHPRILMFDEATSALDNVTQKIVSDSLDKLKCTRIVIAHRLSTIRNCDRIIVLDGGRIIEDGTYDELLAKNGVFAELVERQRV